MAKNKEIATVKIQPRGGFTQIYNSFLDSELLTQYEKLVFIAIKSYADNKTKKSYPSLATISRVTGTSISQVRRCVKHMEELGILDIQHRRNEKYGNVQNLYTIHDDPKIWSVTTIDEDDIEAVAEEISDAKLIAELEKRGYAVTSIKKEPASGTDQSSDVDTFKNQYSKDNDSMIKANRQEKYSLDELKYNFDYEALINDYPADRQQIEYVIQIIYDTVNSTNDTIRVQKTDRPTEVVSSVLMKLTGEEIMYVINKYKEQTDRIEFPKAYMLTQLYEAKGQYDADITNQVQYDMRSGGWNGIV